MESTPNNFSISLQHSFKDCILPRIFVKYQNEDICFLIDTGCNSSIIDNVLYNNKCENKDDLTESSFLTSNGSITTNVTAVPVNFVFEGKEYNIRMKAKSMEFINDSLEEFSLYFHGILGIDFLAANGWIIDFETQTLSSRAECDFDFSDKTSFNFDMLIGLNSSINVPVIPIYFGEDLICSIIDTGADCCCFDKRIQETFADSFIVLNSKEKLHGLGGSFVSEKAISKFQIEGHPYQHSAVLNNNSSLFDSLNIGDSLAIYGIIGCDFFHKHKWIIDFSCFTVYAMKI